MQIKRKISREIAEEPESNEDDQLEGLSKKNEVKFRVVEKAFLVLTLWLGTQKKVYWKRRESHPIKGESKGNFHQKSSHQVKLLELCCENPLDYHHAFGIYHNHFSRPFLLLCICLDFECGNGQGNPGTEKRLWKGCPRAIFTDCYVVLVYCRDHFLLWKALFK